MYTSHFWGNDRYLVSRMENDKITIPNMLLENRERNADWIQFNSIRFYSIFIYFQQDSKAMTCLCFKLIDLFWFYCFDTIAASISYISPHLYDGCSNEKSLKESTNNTLFNCWKSIKSFERITLNFYIVMKCAVPFAEHTNTILMLIFRRRNNKILLSIIA